MPTKDPAYEQRIQDAIEALNNGSESSIRGAATSHSVSFATLQARLAGYPSMISKCVNQQVLTPSEEEQLVTYLKKLYVWGFPCYINEISQYAETILQ